MSNLYQKKANKRVIILTFFLVIWACGLGLRLIQLQIIEHATLKAQVTEQNHNTVKVIPERGTIFDRKGNILARSLPRKSVFYTPFEEEPYLSQCQTIDKLKGVLDLSDRELWIIKNRIKKNAPFIWVKRKIYPEEEEKVKSLHLGGIHLLEENKRFYPQGKLAAHLLGRVDIDDLGASGVEKEYNSILEGKIGKRLMLMDAKRRDYRMETVEEPEPGRDLILTIDETIQYIAEKELERAVQESEASWGTVVIGEPITGEILAMANYPNFDPNDVTTESLKFLKNNAVCDMFEPGSVFKIATLIAAIDTGAFEPERKIFCENGEWKIPGTILNDWKPYDELSYMEVFKNSSNIGVAKIATSLEKDMFYLYIKKLGFGELSGIDFPGEAEGMLRHYTQWSRTSSYIVPIGQEVGVTLLQLVRAYAVVANGGYLVKPHIVKSVQVHGFDRDTPLESYRVISEESANRTALVLIEVVEGGTGRLAQIEKMTVGGKTGTAQKYDAKTKTYSLTKYRASFVGFVSNCEPPLVVGVTIDEPQGVHLGGTVAAPLFQKIASKAIAYIASEDKFSRQ